jgi:hypothetical protein
MPLRTEPDYVWVRNGKKYMQVVQGYQVVTGSIDTTAVATTPAAVEAAPAPVAVDTQTVAAPAPAEAEAPVAAPAAAGGSK